MSRKLVPALRILTATALVLPSSSQSFVPGDVYVQAYASPSGGILARFERATETTTPAFAIPGGASIGLGTMAWDPSRKALVLMLSVDGIGAPSLVALRADGSIEDLTGPIGAHYGLSPAKNGLIYCWTIGNHIQYVEPDGSLHELLDASTGLPFAHDPGIGIGNDVLGYHAPSHSLYTALSRGSSHPCNGGTPGIIVSRLPLSPDGTAVVGPVQCTLLTMPPQGGNGFPVAWISLPSGRPALATTGTLVSTASAPRIFELDPDTLDLTTFASPGGYTGVALVNAACWSWAEKRVLTLDPWADALHGFAKGQSGAGVVHALSLDFATTLSTLVEVPPRRVQISHGLVSLLSGLLAPQAAEVVLVGETDEASGAVSVRLEGARPAALAWVRVVAGPRGATRSALLDAGELVSLPVEDGDLWQRLLADRVALLDGPGELRLQALVVDGGRASLTDELLLAVD